MEDISMNDEYEMIKEFECHGEQMMTVRIRNAALAEWHKVYGRKHQEQWKPKVD